MAQKALLARDRCGRGAGAALQTGKWRAEVEGRYNGQSEY